jgi:RNA polymerase sigma-70 factor (ECF subfamily)
MKPGLVPLRRIPPAPPEMSDDALLAACAVGDRGALSILFERHRSTVRRFCARIAGPADADDLLQITFLAAWTDARSFRGGSAQSWLFAIAANQARKQMRTETRKRGLMDRIRGKPPAAHDPVDEQVARRELLQQVARAVAELPPDLRVPYVMCEIEDVPCAEAAERLGLRPGTLWRRLHDARKRLVPLLRGRR